MCRRMWSLQNLRVVCRGPCILGIYPHETDVRVDRFFWEIGADVFRKGFVLCGKGSGFAERGSAFAERVLFWSVCSGKGADGTWPILRKGFGTFAERGLKGFV